MFNHLLIRRVQQSQLGASSTIYLFVLSFTLQTILQTRYYAALNPRLCVDQYNGLAFFGSMPKSRSNNIPGMQRSPMRHSAYDRPSSQPLPWTEFAMAAYPKQLRVKRHLPVRRMFKTSTRIRRERIANLMRSYRLSAVEWRSRMPGIDNRVPGEGRRSKRRGSFERTACRVFLLEPLLVAVFNCRG